MNIQKIITLGGKITLDDISNLVGSDITLIIDELKEDLLQASMPLEQIIDIGWYPEFSEDGSFRTSLISNKNWESPIYSEKAKTWAELDKALEKTLSKIKMAQGI
ncbi:hypothetical protein [Pseudomonas koreensis]|uniref:hypothetical protein n=1 Tax=Pseudomonas koreensis TaxID=198620 RepID=UPI0020774C83|nr:hypothetical protein [Pseudomonas koreensis]MCM8744838.1 hypothetical protein [Pseudomonas koreensis]